MKSAARRGLGSTGLDETIRQNDAEVNQSTNMADNMLFVQLTY